MLPFIIGGAVVLGVAALMADDAVSSNKRARREYKHNYNKSVSKIKNNYYNAQQKDALDKLSKAKKIKIKISNKIYKEFKNKQKNFAKINQNIYTSKKTLDKLFSQKRATEDREKKRLIQQNINTVQLSRKELFKIKDRIKIDMQMIKSKLDKANEETQDIIDILQNSSETMALASSNGDAKASLPSFARTLMIFLIRNAFQR